MKLGFTLGILLSLTCYVGAQKVERIQIASEYDDMEEFLPAKAGEVQDSIIGELDYESSYIELGYKDAEGITPQLCGFRFSDILIGNGREIESAFLEFKINTDKYQNACAFYIFAEDVANAEEFASAASSGGPGGTPPSGGGAPPTGGGTDAVGTTSSAPEYDSLEMSSRTMLVDSVLWTLAEGESVAQDEVFQTVDISLLVQQIINKADWDSTNAMAFYIKPKNGAREVFAYELDEASAAVLEITYKLNHADSLKLIADSIQAVKDSLRRVSIDSVYTKYTTDLLEEDYTIPTWTLLQRAKVTFEEAFDYDSESVDALLVYVDSLKSKERPYNVSMALNGNPKHNLGFAWFTNQGIDAGELQIVEGVATSTSDFNTPLLRVAAKTTDIYDLPYCNSKNGLDELAGFEDGATRNYTSHKAKATGLSAKTTYSYRVGKEGAWSPIGTFKTAKEEGDTVRFMYMADTQAMNDEYFGVSQEATMAAYKTIPDAQFCLMTGDLIESQGTSNAEWEWEQWFELMQPVWKNVPVAPVIGNHDISANKNLTYHFNTDSIDFDQAMSTTPGGVYSFVHGDALFIAMSTEDYRVDGFIDSLKQYVIDEVDAHPDVRWKFVFYHKTIYTGSSSHQSDSDAKTVREAMLPTLDSLGIDIAFQGHDHIYEVIGVTRNYSLVEGSVMAVDSVSEGGVRANMTGNQGGVYDVTNGTLFFLNCSAGKKKYSPRTEAEMGEAESTTGITNYWGLFTGKFGQPDLATFSDVKVTYDTVFVTTYTVDDDGNAIDVYDSFKVTKNGNLSTGYIVSAEAVGGGSVTGTGTYANGENVTLTAVPADGYVFDSWSGDFTSTYAAISFTIDSDVRVIPTFTESEEDDNGGVITEVQEVTKSEFSLYPNPSASTLTISGIEKIQKVGIYSLSGSLIKVLNSGSNIIDVSCLANGCYLVKIKSEDRLYIEQFIVQK